MLAHAFCYLVKRRDHIVPEAGRVIVVWIQRQPSDRHRRLCGPVGQQGGLAEAGWCAHQHQRQTHPLVEPLK